MFQHAQVLKREPAEAGRNVTDQRVRVQISATRTRTRARGGLTPRIQAIRATPPRPANQ